MEIILLDKIDNLGNVGDVVRVKPGYARNYLFPKGLAVRSSKRNIAFVEEKRKNIELKIAKKEQASQAIFDSLKNVEILMEVEVGENDKLFGSVTTMDLQKALNDQNLEIQEHHYQNEQLVCPSDTAYDQQKCSKEKESDSCVP